MDSKIQEAIIATLADIRSAVHAVERRVTPREGYARSSEVCVALVRAAEAVKGAADAWAAAANRTNRAP